MRPALLLAIPAVFSACTTTRYVSPGEVAAVAPALSVERFLQAANARDLHGMARIFGTPDGPIIDTGSSFKCAFKKLGSWLGMGERCRTIQEVEIQMDALARVLRHEDYSIASESVVAGRNNPTSRVGVNLLIGGVQVQDVPFLVVRSGDGKWFIEEIGVDRITNR
jgi:hypothetical protein